ncbi:MAG: NifU family protein [Candidatus Omnitrophica bacterium]|nr:NifU family protein [Candidatus Omnitrophota bacterium]MCM8769205.1 NifU family protein [Candidatus Omnitrophota bacterium]
MTLKEKVEEALVDVRQLLRGDGGDCQVVEADNGVVKVKLTGACRGCPFAAITMKMRVEKIIKDRVPEVKEVVSVEEVNPENEKQP